MPKLAIDGGSPVRATFLPFGAPCLGEEEIEEVVATLRSRWIGTGPRVQQFEASFAKYVGAPHAVAVSSCTAALHLALLVAGVKPGDEVITTVLTFAATANAIIYCGAKPVFVDIEPETLNLDPQKVAEALSPRTKAVIPVHFGGLPVDLEALAAVVGKIPIIEDAAHAIGSRYRGKIIGGHGNCVCFSFYPNKNITTIEGGLLTFFEESYRERFLRLRQHGMDRDAWNRYQTQTLVHCVLLELGFKYNMTDVQAAMGLHQLKRVEDFLARREAIAVQYDQAFATLPGVRRQFRPRDLQENRHGLHLYVLILDPEQYKAPRDHIVMALRAENIGAGIHYTPLHQEIYYRQLLGLPNGSFPVAEEVGANIFTLPLTPCMDEQDVRDVIDATLKVLNAYLR